ncbi:MAG TPA: hypothetical protein VGI51_03975 [Steroidobacteraceae bacterium]|jgi:hypothetical protein
MRLPQIEQAFVDERKIKDYLLAAGHPAGKGKARFFIGLGFQQNHASALQKALLGHAANNDIKSVMETQFGSKYVIEGPLAAPDGQFAQIRAIWFSEGGAGAPRFVTAYPLKGNRSP